MTCPADACPTDELTPAIHVRHLRFTEDGAVPERQLWGTAFGAGVRQPDLEPCARPAVVRLRGRQASVEPPWLAPTAGDGRGADRHGATCHKSRLRTRRRYPRTCR